MNPAALFLKHLDAITGRSEDLIQKIDSSDPALPPVYVFVYRNWPKDGIITGFTFGLSATDHPDWKFGKPELMIGVESTDEIWPFAIGHIAEQLRGQCPFCYGNTLNFNDKISKESDLDAFLVFAPPFLEKEQMKVELGSYTCNITGMYPMFSSEFELYEELGIKEFWHLPDWDPLNIRRQPIQQS